MKSPTAGFLALGSELANRAAMLRQSCWVRHDLKSSDQLGNHCNKRLITSLLWARHCSRCWIQQCIDRYQSPWFQEINFFFFLVNKPKTVITTAVMKTKLDLVIVTETWWKGRVCVSCWINKSGSILGVGGCSIPPRIRKKCFSFSFHFICYLCLLSQINKSKNWFRM